MSIPSSTYRIQLHVDFNFQKLEGILDYLQDLGISTVYASPITAATKGSQHGYDVTNPLIISPEIGTEAELARLAGILKEKNMNWLQDIVPNHMAFESRNAWLYDALERGKNSEYYRFFDIDTDHSTELTGTKIMAPFLGKTLTECLQAGELRLEYKFNGSVPPTPGSQSVQGFVISYYDNDYPISIFSYQWICTIAEGCPPELLTALRHLEPTAMGPADSWAAEKKKWLEQVAANEAWMSFLRQRIDFFNGQPSLVAELLNSQHYILTHSQLAASRINYRRFFTVNSLICLRMEDPIVFSAYHEKIRQWVEKGYLQGLRIDHIDGLAAPRRYIRDLKQLMGNEFYIVAEKILAADEEMPEDWQLEGTSGYEFLSIVNQLLTDERGYKELQDFYQGKINALPPYQEIVFGKKYDFLKSQMGGEWNNLIDLLLSLPSLEAAKMDKDRLKEALAILMAYFPVYRVYPELPDFPDSTSSSKPVAPDTASQVNPSDGSPSFPPASRQFIDTAFSRAAAHYPDGSPELNFLRDIFGESGSTDQNKDQDYNQDKAGNKDQAHSQDKARDQKIFQARLMQFTGPLAAKGIEDTTFYVYNPLISRNEVGDSPGVGAMTPAAFHEKMADRQAHHPYSLNATATHDTKRGEDARIRLNWLSAIPEEWMGKVTHWLSDLPEGTDTAPSANDKYFIYQSLIGSFPVDLLVTDTYRERCHQFLTKALREAKTNTNYDAPNEAYEKSSHAFLTALLEQESAFLKDFIPFVNKVIHSSAAYSLSQELVKLTAPGIPDIYQGADSWDLSLVDPDNRLPVDYSLRREVLTRIKAAEAKGAPTVLDFVAANLQKGAGKLFTIYKTLNYRKQHPQVFTAGDYIPLEVPGSLLSYIRRYKEDWALVIIPLIRKERSFPDILSIHLPADTPREWMNLFTGEQVSCNKQSGHGLITLELKKIFSQFPVILLTGKSA